jgi:flagellar hook protein FlgE
MSLFNTLRIGASGLNVSSLSLATVGDNIANLNTVGYKRNTASFADSLPQSITTLGGIQQIGNGAVAAGMSTTFSQGQLMGSANVLDLAIGGQGFFQVNNGSDQFFTRDGSFTLDKDNYVVNSAGLRVQGYSGVDGDLSTSMGDLKFDLGALPPKATESLTMRANLDANMAISNQLAGLTLDGAGATFDQIGALQDTYQTSISVYDSLGKSHDVQVVFEKTAENTWNYTALVDAGEVEINGAPGTAGNALQIASGTASFDNTGKLSTFTQAPGTTPWGFPGAQDFSFDLSVGLDGTPGGLTSFGNASSVYTITQDGYGVGELASMRVDPDGTIQGVFTNGQEQSLGKVAVVDFAAESGLDRVGGNLWRATMASGEPAVGEAGSGGRGSIQGYALERSNVELEDEFISMIQAQRSYQGNASVIRTSNETLQTLVSLV